MTVTYASSADAIAGGWSFNYNVTTGKGYGGATTSVSSWWGEKKAGVQCGGKLVACASDASSSAWKAMERVDNSLTAFSSSLSPENSSFNGTTFV